MCGDCKYFAYANPFLHRNVHVWIIGEGDFEESFLRNAPFADNDFAFEFIRTQVESTRQWKKWHQDAMNRYMRRRFYADLPLLEEVEVLEDERWNRAQ